MTARRLADRVGRLAAWALPAGALALPFVGGFPLAYVLMLLAIGLIALWLADRPSVNELVEPTGAMTVLGVLLLFIAFAATAQKPYDLLYVGNFTMLALLPLLRAALTRFSSPDASAICGWLAFAGAAISAVVGLWQVGIEQQPRATGIGSDSIWSAQAALIVGMLALMAAIREAGWRRYLLAAAPSFAAIAVALSGSRGPMLAMVPLVAVTFVFARGHRRLVLASGVAAGLVLFAAAPYLWPDLGGRITTLGAAATEAAQGEMASNFSIGARQIFYQGAINAFLASPWFGYGWEDRLMAAYAHGPSGFEETVLLMGNNRHLHADVLDLGVAGGLVGLVAYLLFIAAPVVGAMAAPRDGQRQARLRGAAILSTGYLTCGLTYIMLGYEFPTTQYVVIATILLGLCRDRPAHPGSARAGGPAPATSIG